MTGAFFAVWIVSGLLSAVVAGTIAGNRGYSSGAFFLYGCFLPLIAIIHAFTLKPSDQHLIDTGVKRECSECNELVTFNAKICKHCNATLDNVGYAKEWREWDSEVKARDRKRSNKQRFAFIGTVVIGVSALILYVNTYHCYTCY